MTVTFFALAGFIFLVTQYFQVVRGLRRPVDRRPHTPGGREHRGRPRSPAGCWPRDWGPAPWSPRGLLMFGSSMAWIAASPVDVPYATSIVPQMVLLGLGMGLISTPATESILRVLPPARAGRRVGGQRRHPRARRHAGRRGGRVGLRVGLRRVAHRRRVRPVAGGGCGPGPRVGRRRGGDRPGPARAARRGADAFMAGMHAGSLLVAVLCLVGAVVAAIALPGRRFTRDNARGDELAGARTRTRLTGAPRCSTGRRRRSPGCSRPSTWATGRCRPVRSPTAGVGEIWRLDATSGSWAVKTERNEMPDEGLAPRCGSTRARSRPGSSRRHPADAATAGSSPTVANRRSGSSTWVDMAAADPGLDPVAVGSSAGRRCTRLPEARSASAAEAVGRCRAKPWFHAPVGGAAWDDLLIGWVVAGGSVRRRTGRAPRRAGRSGGPPGAAGAICSGVTATCSATTSERPGTAGSSSSTSTTAGRATRPGRWRSSSWSTPRTEGIDRCRCRHGAGEGAVRRIPGPLADPARAAGRG